MATQNTIGIGVVISDNGTAKKTIKNVEELHSTIKKTQTTAEKGVNLGGTAGSRKAVAAGYQPGGAALAASAPTGSAELMQYGQMRGSAGATGASARDFANQAQGLGGLVRLYATYAANIFAVGAAFRALSNAFDTTNMVKGLDQLGASSGMALGTLSKRLVVATDGAISLREAMESVAKASSSGMSSENILRMGKVAKQASQALGVDMADAVNRITRGITKLEPELLDEIGIFTRVDSAVKEYAKSTGKAASALTDFERRMAFANAVLEEGERKFSAIEIDTNPYTKLSAAVKNAAQEGLELANTVLAPIVNLLSQSPTALMAILGSLGLLLVRQALPAIGEFKAGLANAADQATEVSIQRAQDAADAKSKIEKLALQELTNNADAKVDAIDRAQARIDSIQSDSVRKTTKLYRTLQDETFDLTTLTDKQIASFERSTKLFEKTGGDSNAVKSEYEAIAALKEGRDAELAIRGAIEKTAVARKAAEGGIGTYAQTLRIAEKAQTNATKAQIVSTAAYNGSLVGLKDSFALMREDIAKSNLQLNTFSKATLMARGGIAILGGAISTLGTVLSGAFMWIGLITGALAILDSIFSKASKEVAAFESGVGSLDQATSNLRRTLDTINSNNPFSVKSLEAQGTAMMEFSSSVDELGKSANKALAALKDSGWDRFKNTIKSIWGGDVKSTFSDSLAQSISTAVEDLENSPIQTKLRQTLGSILNIKDVTNVKELEKALSKLEPSSAIVKEISKAIKQAGIEASNTASKAREFSDAFKKSEESFNNFTKQFDNKDPLVQYAVGGMKALGELSATISGPLSGSLDNITTLLNGLNENPIFGVEKSQELAQYASEMGSINETIVEQTNKVQELTEAREEQERALKALTESNAAVNNRASQGQRAGEVRRSGNVINDPQGLAEVQKKAVEQQKAVLDATNRALLRAQDNIAMASARGNMIAEKVSQEIPNGISRGKELLITALDASLAKGANAFKSSIISSFGNLPGFAKAEANVQIGEIGIEKKLLDVQFQMLREQVAIKLATTKSALLAERAILEKAAGETNPAQGRDSIQQKLTANIANTDAVTNAMVSVKAGKSYKDALVGIEKLDQNSRELLTGYAISVASITAKLQQLGQQQLSIRFQAEVKEIQAKATQAQQVLDTEAKNLQLSKDQLAIRKDLTAEERLANETSISKSTILNTASKEQVAAAFAYAEISTKIAAYESLKTKKADDAVALEAARVEQARLYENIVQAGVKRQVALATEDEASKKRGLELGLKREAQLASMARIEEGIAQNSKEAGLSIEEQRLSVLQEILGTDSRAYTTLQTSLDAQRQQLDVERQIADVKAQSGDRLRSLRSEALNAETDTTRATQIKDEIEQEKNRAALQISNIQAVSAARTEARTAIQAQNDLLAQQNETLASTESLANSLASAFGSVGEGLGGAIVGLQNFIAAQEQSALKQATLTAAIEKANKAGSSKEGLQLQKQLDKEVQNSKQKELDGIADVIGSTKKMFKEKTAAHKVLAATEKALHIVRIAMNIKEMFFDTAKTSVAVGNSATRTAAAVIEAGVSGVKAVVTAIASLPFPLNIAAGVATAAVVGQLLSSIGGKKPTVGAPATAEQRQETQGTAMGWDNQGNKVQTSRGVFGDTDAKSESIANSLERIKETSVDGLRYDNKMIDLLSKINDGINNTAKSLYSIRGLRQGSLFDTQEGTTKGKGLLGSGLFGSKTSTNITDSGVLINATFADLASTTSRAAIQFYEDVTTTKKKWYGSSKTSYSRNLKTADQITQDYFNDIFSNATELFKEIGQDAGMQAEQVLSSLSGVSFANLSVSLRGLKGEDLEKELNAVISSMLDQGAEAVFSQFMQFEEFGEGMLETVIRVTDNNRKVKQALSNLGIGTLRNVVGMASYEITEALVGAAGGIQDFLAKAEDYREKFLTEAERLAPIQLEVTAEIARIAKLGFTSADGLVDTRQEFKALVSSLDLTSETGRTAYTALMNVSEGFHQVTEATETALQATIDKFKKFADDLRAFRDNLVLGSSSILTPLQKYEESKLQFESTYANALAGDEAAQGKLTNSAQTFLTASKDYFASSSQYTQDFNSVLDKVGAGITEAEVQISLAEKQLKGIEAQLALLTTIDQNIATIAGVPQAATGGRVQGLTLVGERGPELVDFTNPGMVYPADQTRGMFAPQASMSNNIYQVVAELRQVKQELAQLRQEQRQQTGDLIVSNYDANNRAAETISAEVALTTTQKEWQERNAPAVV